MSKVAIEFYQVCKIYKQANSPVMVLDNVSFTINQGQVVAIVGASGSGKSTLLHLAGLLDDPTAGEITVLGRKIKDISEKEKDLFRLNNLGFVYQYHHLLADFTAIENVMMPQIIKGVGHKTALKNAQDILSRLDMLEKANNFPGELSGGQQQRVAIARSMINKPNIILADEPTGNLDNHNAAEVFALMRNLALEFQTTILLATHSQELADKADRILHVVNHEIA